MEKRERRSTKHMRHPIPSAAKKARRLPFRHEKPVILRPAERFCATSDDFSGFSPVQNGSVIVQTVPAPLQKGFVLVQNDSVPLQNGSALVQKDPAPLQKGSALAQNGSGGLQDGSVLVQNGFVGLQNGSTFVQEAPASPQDSTVSVQNGSVPAQESFAFAQRDPAPPQDGSAPPYLHPAPDRDPLEPSQRGLEGSLDSGESCPCPRAPTTKTQTVIHEKTAGPLPRRDPAPGIVQPVHHQADVAQTGFGDSTEPTSLEHEWAPIGTKKGCPDFLFRVFSCPFVFHLSFRSLKRARFPR